MLASFISCLLDDLYKHMKPAWGPKIEGNVALLSLLFEIKELRNWEIISLDLLVKQTPLLKDSFEGDILSYI